MGSMKEPHYYNTDEKFVRTRNRSDYLSLFKGCGPQYKYYLDASTWYLHSKDAIPKILKDCPDARFVVCVRNPVDMAFSLHGHFLNRACREHVKSFEQAWKLADERMQGRAVSPRATDPRYLAYSYSCRIGSQCRRLLRQVDRERVYFVVFDELVSNQSETLRSVLSFLGLRLDVEMELPVENIRRDVRSVRIQRAIRRLDKRLSRIPAGRLVVKRLTKRLQRMNQSGRSKTLDPGTRRRLTEYFRGEIETLWEVLGQRYEMWITDP